MSTEHGAWSVDDRAQRTVCSFCRLPFEASRVARCPGAAFTLIEMLIVIALVAILTTLLAPSMQGLFGVVGRRGGANALALGIEQARLEAVKHGTPAFVGFAIGTNEAAYSSFIIYRALRFDEAVTNTNLVTAVSRWMRLPRGVFIQPQDLASAVTLTQNVASNALPRLGSDSISSLRSLQFDRFGKLVTTNVDPPTLRVGEGIFNGTSVTFIPDTNNYYELSIQPLTGQVVMRDGVVAQP